MAEPSDSLDQELADLVAEAAATEEAAADAAAADAEAEAEVAAEEVDQVAELTQDLQRLTAEYANFRKRTERDRQQAGELAQGAVLVELLPVLDDLDLAAQHGELEGPLKAMKLKLDGVLSKFEVVAFGEAGEPFDPDRHEAVQDFSEGEEKTLGQVLRRGYEQRGRVLRTAMVIVG